MSLDGTAAAITGAGSGFGRATARLFADRGASVVAVDVDEAALEETVALIDDDDPPGEAVAVPADVTDGDQVAAFVEATVETFGRIDVLHSNAGVVHPTTPATALPEAEWDRVHGVNLKGVFLGAKHAAAEMRARGGGAIVNTASIAATRPRAGLSAYVASKGGVLALTRALACELAADGVRVNAVSPVVSPTGMVDGLTEAEVAEMVETIPLGRMADPTDVAEAVAFLADEETAGMITAENLRVDGGRGI
jgi:3-oxoacyl-[acyl-carrier protein] reductase